MKVVLLILGFAATARAACPGMCSGHGACGESDKCTCYPNWKGGDCGSRVCPYRLSWSDTAGHAYAECSDRGECDRKSGECKCFDGFEGIGCERMSCPDDCNNHGTCQLMADVASSYSAWDANKIQKCVCDPGYTGPNCGSRMCAPGDDPMTVSQVSEVQTIIISGTTITGEFSLSYTDWRGETWTTHAMKADTATEISVTEALKALPNHAIPGVTVTKNRPDANSVTFVVTFSNSHTPGDQEMLTINTAGCAVSGCQPYYSGVTGGSVTASVSTTTAATTENTDCSGRGSCDGDSGSCVCYEGYHGEMCESQTIIM